MNGLKENECPDLLTLVKVRSSVRSFKSSKVERAKLEYILEVARLAPSAVNFQPNKIHKNRYNSTNSAGKL